MKTVIVKDLILETIDINEDDIYMEIDFINQNIIVLL